MYVYTHTHICIRTRGKCSFEKPKGKFSAELGSFQARLLGPLPPDVWVFPSRVGCIFALF